MVGRRSKSLAIAAVAAGLTFTVTAPASAAPGFQTLATGLVGPLHLNVQGDGTVFVSEAFAGVLTRVDPDGTKHLVVAVKGEMGGVQAEPNGSAVYTFTGGTAKHPVGTLNRVTAGGATRQLADIYGYEKAHNPDARNSYGFQGLSNACANKIPKGIPARPYKGIVESHPYSVTALPGGAFAVADAAANAIWRVGPNGRVTTLGVLPPVPTTITAAMAGPLGLPACTVGKDFNFEPVPTDVKVGPDGMVYVTSLPGGPESAVLGARGGVFMIHPGTGHVMRVASGFLGATSLAIDPDGRIYVTELFGNQVSYVKNGGPQVLSRMNSPAAIDFARGHLYVTKDAVPAPHQPPDGKVVKIGL